MSTHLNVLNTTRIEGFEDIIFENHNKEYGAYKLRKDYKRRIILGFFFSTFFFLTIVSAPLFRAYMGKGISIVHKRDTVVVSADLDDIEPPKLPDVKIPDPPAQVFVPLIVDTVTEMPILASIDDLIEQQGNVEPPADLNTAVVVTHDDVIENNDPPILMPQVSAQFNGGGLSDFRDWVQKNVVYPSDAADAEIEGRVTVQFVVNSKGQVSDIKILKGVHPSIDEEVIKVLSSSPVWIPGEQGGRKVKQLFVLPVIFKLSR